MSSRLDPEHFSKGERECAYWLFLALVLLAYCCVIDKDLFLSAVEDLGITLSNSLLSPNGALTLGLLFIVVCRCANKGIRAFYLGVVILVFVGVLLLLHAYVFPKHLVPIEFDDDDVWFARNSTGTHSHQAGKPAVEVPEAVKEAEAQFEVGMSGMETVLGFGLLPILMLVVFGAVIWCFRIDSSVAIAATIIVIIMGISLGFKVLILDAGAHPHAHPHPKALPTHPPLAKPIVTHAPKHTVLHTTDKPAGGSGYWPLRPKTLAATPPTDRLTRLRGIEARLDDLLQDSGSL